MDTVITLKRLDDFGEVLREYGALLKQKSNLEKRINPLKGVDYSKEKVINGTSRKNSEQERYVLQLEKINARIAYYDEWLIPEREIIETQIARVRRWEYRKILVLRYIEKWKWSEIIHEFFSFENDFEEQKRDKYKDKVLYWNRQALKELEKVGQKSYIKTEEQLRIL